MSLMPAVSHHVVGVIEVSSDPIWSPDALVRESLGIEPCSTHPPARMVFAYRVPASSSATAAQVRADFSRLRDDLDQLLESFLTNCQE
jgi:hypothetical protein